MMFSCAKLPTFLLQITQIFPIFYENIPFVDIKEN